MDNTTNSIDNILQVLPSERLECLKKLIARISPTVEHEAYVLFQAIIKDHPGLHIYNFGLYFSGGSWSYCVPTFSSYEGLKHAVSYYQKHSVISEEQQTISLRWSACDSPHHDTAEYDQHMSGFSNILDELHKWENTISPEALGCYEDYEDYYEVLGYWHDRCEQAVIDALKKVRAHTDIARYCERYDSVITLEGTDRDERYWLDSVLQINGDRKAAEIKQDIEELHRISELEIKLWREKEEEELENPPQPSFILEDLQPVVDAYIPRFINADDGAVIIDPPPYEYIGLGNLSSAEFNINRIDIMPLLRASEHGEEVDKLYGHFIGPDFHETHIVTEFARLIRAKIAGALLAAYPSDEFVLYMHISRMARPMIQFYKVRGDGFEHHCFHSIEYPDMNRGTEESITINHRNTIH